MNIRKIPKVIHVSPQEDVAGIAALLSATEEQHIYLVIPDKSHLFRNHVNLRLLKRESDARGKDVTLVSGDISIERSALKAGFSCITELPESLRDHMAFKEHMLMDRDLSSVSQEPTGSVSQELHGRKMFDILPPRHGGLPTIVSIPGVSEEIIPKGKGPETVFEESRESFDQEEEFDEGVEEGDAEEVAEGARKEKEQKKPPIQGVSPQTKEAIQAVKKTFRIPALLSGRARVTPLSFFSNRIPVLFFALFLIGVSGAYLFLPKVKIAIKPEKEVITLNIDVEASTAVSGGTSDSKNTKIPAQLLEFTKESSQEFISSGSEERQEKSRGTITVYNAYSSSPQTLVENTRFVSQDGKVFRIMKTIVVPGASIEDGKIIPSSIDTEVQAAEAGAEQNIGPSSFSIPGFKGTPKYTAFYAKSTTAFFGGFIGRVKVVTEDDVRKAKETLEASLREEIRKEFSQKLPADSGLTLLESAKEEQIKDIKTDKNTGDAAEKFVVSGKGIMRALLFKESDVKTIVNKSVSVRIQENSRIIEEEEKIEYRDVRPTFDKGILKISLYVEESIAAVIDADKIKEDIAGLDEVGVRRYFSSRSDIESAQVSFSPRFFLRSVPKNKDKISIEFVYN